ncbi:hypothetical protein IE81DRAFT_142528 [Ceraceosorus guamensis]|uniref:Uncharacterized protein n=1 Tax=Ceraceosorus guamensis TaxID=1522189 RepID=A0A316W070_9BASI|nr:hypothetical protein IE81DRAFT_142528 [Ceraceosorus guamensis]PWN42103.1 hypothetical protein IE81DRAFT_142528 [Ceraceosorus guamensis]
MRSSFLILLLCFVLSASAIPVDSVAIGPRQVVSPRHEPVALRDGTDAGSTLRNALWGLPALTSFQPPWEHRKRANVQDLSDELSIQKQKRVDAFNDLAIECPGCVAEGSALPAFQFDINEQGKVSYKWIDWGFWGDPIAKRSSLHDAPEGVLAADHIIGKSSTEEPLWRPIKISYPIWPQGSDGGHSWYGPRGRRPRALKENILENRSGTSETIRPRAAEAAVLESLPSGTITRRQVGGTSDKKRAEVAEISGSQVNEHRSIDLGVTQSGLRVHSSRSELPDFKEALQEAAKGWGLFGQNWGKRGLFKRSSFPESTTTREKNLNGRRADFSDEEAELGFAQPAFAATIYGRNTATEETELGAAQPDFAIPIYGQGGALEGRDPGWPLVIGNAKKGDKGQTWGRQDVSSTQDAKRWVLPEDGADVGRSTIQTARSAQDVKDNQATTRAPSPALDLDKRAKELAVPINGWANTRGRRSRPRSAHITPRELDGEPRFPYPLGTPWGERSMNQEADAAVSSLLGMRSDSTVEDAHQSQAGQPINASNRLKGPKWGWFTWAGTKPIKSRDSESAPGLGHKVVEEARERDDDLDDSDESANIKPEIDLLAPWPGVKYAQWIKPHPHTPFGLPADDGSGWGKRKRSLRKREVPQDGQVRLKRWIWGMPWGCSNCDDDAAVISR